MDSARRILTLWIILGMEAEGMLFGLWASSSLPTPMIKQIQLFSFLRLSDKDSTASATVVLKLN